MKDRSFYHNSSKTEILALAEATDHPEYWRGFMQMLTPLQQKIIMVIYEREPLSVSAISRYGFVDQQTTSSILCNMKKLGVVRSIGNKKDRRVSDYSLHTGLKNFLLSGERTAP